LLLGRFLRCRKQEARETRHDLVDLRFVADQRRQQADDGVAGYGNEQALFCPVRE